MLYLFAIVALCSSIGRVESTDHSTSRLNFHIPHALFREEGYNHSQAAFGIPSYGGALRHNLYYADTDGCSGSLDASTGYPIRPDNPETNRMEEWPSPFILMIDRGHCSFVEQVFTAEHAGAAGVIIADNTCLCSDMECTRNSDSCVNEEPVMNDNGSGVMVSIPSFLMVKSQADLVKKELMANRPVLAEMEWAPQNVRDIVDYQLWTLPMNKHSEVFFPYMKDLVSKLGQSAIFTPHMKISDGSRTGCTKQDVDFCPHTCTNYGRYCAEGGTGFSITIKGEMIVRESLRRICIWNLYGDDGIGLKWWDYVIQYGKQCTSHRQFGSHVCIERVFNQVGIDGSQVDSCMVNSGDLDKDRPNVLLEKELDSLRSSGVVTLPSMTVNDGTIEGYLNEKEIFEAVCAGYELESMPYECLQCVGCADVQGCIANGVCTDGLAEGESKISDDNNVSSQIFGISWFLVVAAFSILGLIYYQGTRVEMKQQVRNVMAEYVPLAGDESSSSPNSFL